MPRLIDANEILKSEHQHYDYRSDEYYVHVRDIENAPTVDAELVRHGHWINKTVCSICGEWEDFHDGYRLYCPNCGAKMDEVEDDRQ